VLAGKFGDLFGRKAVFQVSAGIFVLGLGCVWVRRQHDVVDRLTCGARTWRRRSAGDGDLLEKCWSQLAGDARAHEPREGAHWHRGAVSVAQEPRQDSRTRYMLGSCLEIR
jgi:hypothetical protein